MRAWAAPHLLRPQPGWVVLGCAVLLAVQGTIAVGTVAPELADRQRVWLAAGLIAAGVCALPRPRWLLQTAWPLYGLNLGALVFVLLPFVPRSIVPIRNGATAWIDMGFFTVQPSEPAKITFVLACAAYLRHRESYRTLPGLMLPFAVMATPTLLVLEEPDLGTATLYAPGLLAMLLAAGAKLRHIGGVLGLGLAAVALIVAAIYVLPESAQPLRPHQRDRIRALVSRFQGETRYADTIGYQQRKAVTLVGAGGATGYGPRARTILRHNKLPYDYNDMIFAVIANRWGAVGALGTLLLYTVMFGAMILVAGTTKEPFARLVVVGIAGVMAAQTILNAGIAVGLLPVTGLPLPLVSYGGTSLVTSFAMVGLVVNFGARRAALPMRPSFEFGEEL